MEGIDKLIVTRPWGRFIQFCRNTGCTVKHHLVKPGEQMSLQYHQQRDEYWYILRGCGKVVIGTDDFMARPGTDFFIERLRVHTVSCLGNEPLEILEIAFGKFDEEDIVRVEDKYGRVKSTEE